MRVLRVVASCGSFSAAAEALNFTQSAISQHADAILARIDSAEEELAALAGLRGGRLRLISFQSGGATLAPRAVALVCCFSRAQRGARCDRA